MFNAIYFTYDGIFSGIYGLIIADFDDSSVIETDVYTPTLYTSKGSSSNRFSHNGVSYDAAPSYRFSMISELPITDVTRREVLAWLTARGAFKKLQIHQPDLEDYYYNCVFTDISIIYVNGNCHGFRVTANFDSPYQYGEPSSITVSGSGNTEQITIVNNSDISDDYVYPVVEFSSNSDTNGYSIKIINETDDDSREFIFSGLDAGEHVVVDNELRHIKSSNNVTRLSNFNKNWLRLRKGDNVLKVTINGNVTIKCPTYIMIGF